MTIKEQIKNDLKVAMKAKEIEKRDVLRMLDSMIKNEEIEKGMREKGLDDENVLVLVKRAIKQRNDSIKQYAEGGRDDLADKEKIEVEILNKYLPEQMSDDELEKIVQLAIEESGATSSQDIGKVMGPVMQKVGSLADGQRVREVVMKNLR
jgi:uncharacterized protein YqeY